MKIDVYREPKKGIFGEWGAVIDFSESQIQIISPTKKERDKVIRLIKDTLKYGKP